MSRDLVLDADMLNMLGKIKMNTEYPVNVKERYQKRLVR